MKNEYDEIKKMLNTIRSYGASSDNSSYLYKKMIKEQDEYQINKELNTGTGENEDVLVINNVDINIASDEALTAKITDEEKAKISQMIDDFKTDVSNIVEINSLKIYNNSAKLDGKLSDPPVTFTFSSGDDTGIYIGNASMLKLTEDNIETLKKMLLFQDKFITTMNEVLNNLG